MSFFPHAELFRAVRDLTDLPADIGAEVAFAGRSNAGKSSAINTLLKRRNLAAVSKTPGRTRTINFFRLEEHRYLVDLPGYGYAAVAQAEHHRWDELIGTYLKTRRALRGLVLICDARRPFTPLDRHLVDWFAPTGKPVHVLLTKADKLSRSEAMLALKQSEMALQRDYPRLTVQLFSGITRAGVAAAQKMVGAWLK